MKIQLIDRNREMCAFWRMYFGGLENVIVHCGDFFDLPTDCVVSPANSYGYMDGGLDKIISLQLGWQVQEKLQKVIKEKYNGELLVGQAELIETDYKDIPFCISAPTMRIPMILENVPNVYLAARAIFLLLRNEDRIKTISISGMGTGVGKLDKEICARQMRQAYNDVVLEMFKFPETWEEAQSDHLYLCEKQI